MLQISLYYLTTQGRRTNLYIPMFLKTYLISLVGFGLLLLVVASKGTAIRAQVPPTTPRVTTSLFVWGDTNDMCFINADSARGVYQSQGSHCKVTTCSTEGSTVPGRLVVDYTNNRLPIQNPLFVSVQINKCAGKLIGDLEGITRSECNGYVDRRNEVLIPFDKTLRCVWEDPFKTGSKSFRCSLVDTKMVSACSDLSPSSGPSPTTRPLPKASPTQKVSPTAKPTATPPKSRTTTSPTPPKTSPTKRPTPTNKPSPTSKPLPPTGTWSLSTNDLLGKWSFTPHISFRSFMSFKFGICDTYKDEAYRTTDSDLAAHCRWFDARPSSAVRKDRITGSLRAAKTQRLDYEDIPLEKGKTYYLTCQYYLIKGPAFRMIPKPSVTYDEWRRCRPKPISKGDIKTFENVLSPQESFEVEERVALSIPGSKRKIAQIGDPIIALTYDLKPLNAGDGTSTMDPKYMQAFRPGICPKAKSPQQNNANHCIFFDPVPLDRDIQNQEDVELALREGKYFTKLHYIIAQDVHGESLRPGDTIGITCQYIYNAPDSLQRVRRCNIKNVRVKQRFHANFFDSFRPDRVIAISEDFVLDEGGEGTIPMIQAASSLPTNPVYLSLCDNQLGNCASIDGRDLQSDQLYAVSNLAVDSPIQKGHTYSLTCKDESGNSCGNKTIIGGEPLYIENSTVSTGRELCDSNKDGECNILDLVDCLKDTKEVPAHCDLDKDKSISATDRSLLLNLAGQSVK
jgi:hypothetical protein